MKQQELERLFRTYYAEMYRMARSLLYDEAESRDAVSEVFSRLADGAIGLRPGEERHYLLTAVRHRCLNVLRHKSVEERAKGLYASEQMLASVDVEEDMERLERLRHFVSTSLPERTQRVFRRFYLDEQGYEAIAAEEGISKVAVYKHLAEARERINEYFNNANKR